MATFQLSQHHLNVLFEFVDIERGTQSSGTNKHSRVPPVIPSGSEDALAKEHPYQLSPSRNNGVVLEVRLHDRLQVARIDGVENFPMKNMGSVRDTRLFEALTESQGELMSDDFVRVLGHKV